MTAREQRRARKFRTIAVIATILFHLMLAAGIYHLSRARSDASQTPIGDADKMAWVMRLDARAPHA